MEPVTILEALRNASKRAQESKPPERYRWHAVWWHLHGKLHKSASAFIYSRNMLDLRRDMISRPMHFNKRPKNKTDWQSSHT